jgi:hypothetical protein
MKLKHNQRNLIILHVCKSQIMTIGQLPPSIQSLDSCLTGDFTTMGSSHLHTRHQAIIPESGYMNIVSAICTVPIQSYKSSVCAKVSNCWLAASMILEHAGLWIKYEQGSCTPESLCLREQLPVPDSFTTGCVILSGLTWLAISKPPLIQPHTRPTIHGKPRYCSV